MLRESQSFRQSSDVSQLPAKFFSSKLSWRLHDLANARYFYVWLFALAIFPVVTTSIVKKTGTWSSSITKFTVFVSAEIVLATLPFASQFKKRKNIKKLRSVLLKEVVELESDFAHKHWDLIAKHVNEYLLQEGLWHSEHCIYDGEECLRYFRDQVYLPFVVNPSEKHDEQLATQIYEKSYEIYWSSQELITKIAALEPNQNLPRDTYRFSIVYDLIHGIKPALKFLPVVVLSSLYMKWKMSLKIIATASVFGFLKLMCSSCHLTRRSRGRALSQPLHILTLLKLEYHSEPGESANKWDEVAKKMNTYLNEEGVLPDKRVFFDGKQCHAKFESLLAATLPDDDIKKSLYPELIRFASEFRAA
ncbi:uncharacterized protein LALA0_S06e00650g [Lachancea lanzarotensis]|uniref:LALA0S06e00650g1_1 n=1 Tax=Lachancea lanzarotensis TaxID=1245769 RepID=A0A0C7MY56_9SACH|nr:uncharacterized protein LALA0_S06e00650g [Lachancea lanzarotensis]CEP62655.1 LALA0S06e00650g1_1 [Lachancea lanzarotensis]